MKYRAKANGNVIHMSDEAAKVLVPSIYERVSDGTPLTASLTPPVPVVTTETPKPRQTKRRKSG